MCLGVVLPVNGTKVRTCVWSVSLIWHLQQLCIISQHTRSHSFPIPSSAQWNKRAGTATLSPPSNQSRHYFSAEHSLRKCHLQNTPAVLLCLLWAIMRDRDTITPQRTKYRIWAIVRICRIKVPCCARAMLYGSIESNTPDSETTSCTAHDFSSNYGTKPGPGDG